MHPHVVLLSIPGLRVGDLSAMPRLSRLAGAGGYASLVPSFPAVTCPVQANMTTGRLPREHGIVANGFFWRDAGQVEMWTSWNDCIQKPQIWDLLHQHDRSITSAVWFSLHSKGCAADYVCTPAPIHNSDGSESMWCQTRPDMLYNELKHQLNHFPLQNFWGPQASIESSAWIAASAVIAAKSYRPNFFYIYLPHLDYAAQRSGPDSKEAAKALAELDEQIAKLAEGLEAAFDESPLWLVASEYAIRPVDNVVFPNRLLREARLLVTRNGDDGEHLDLENSKAWALADHQLSHIFLRDPDPALIRKVVRLFKKQSGIADVLTGDALADWKLDHPRSGEVVLVSQPDSWQAYYWWLEDDRAPAFARTVDIHSKPGYDPVELFFDKKTKSVPLDASLVKGSHGAPATSGGGRGALLASEPGIIAGTAYADTEVARLVLAQYGAV